MIVLDPTDFHCVVKKYNRSQRELKRFGYQSLQKKVSHTGLKRHEGELMLTFRFGVDRPFTLSLD